MYSNETFPVCLFIVLKLDNNLTFYEVELSS